MPNQRKIGALFGYANILVKNIVNLLYTPMLLAFIGQGEYGVYQTVYQLVFSLQLLSFGFSAAYVRFYTMQKASHGEEGVRTLNGMYLILYSIICLLVVILGLGLSGFTKQIFSDSFTAVEIGLAKALITIMTFNMAVTIASTVFDAYIIAHERFSFQQTRQMLTTLMTPCLAFVLLVFGTGAVGVALAQLAVNVTLFLLNVSYAVGRLSMRFGFRRLNWSLLASLAVFSSWLFINQLTDLAVLNLPGFILGAASGAAAAAVFSIAVQLRTLFFSLSTTLSNVFVPLINRIVATVNDDEELTSLMIRVGRYQAMVLCWVLGGFILLGQWFVRVWAGESFIEAYWLTLAMVVPFLVPLVQNVGIEIQRARNKHKARSLSYLLCAAFDLVLTCVLAPSFGCWAAVIGCVCYTVLGPGLFMNWYNHSRVGLNMLLFWRRVLPIFATSAVSVAICCFGTHFFPVDSFVLFLLWGVVYSAAYSAVIVLAVMDERERLSTVGKIASRLGLQKKPLVQ